MWKKHATLLEMSNQIFNLQFLCSLLIAHTEIYLFCIYNLTSDQSLSPELIFAFRTDELSSCMISAR